MRENFSFFHTVLSLILSRNFCVGVNFLNLHTVWTQNPRFDIIPDFWTLQLINEFEENSLFCHQCETPNSLSSNLVFLVCNKDALTAPSAILPLCSSDSTKPKILNLHLIYVKSIFLEKRYIFSSFLLERSHVTQNTTNSQTNFGFRELSSLNAQWVLPIQLQPQYLKLSIRQKWKKKKYEFFLFFWRFQWYKRFAEKTLMMPQC